ncbi:hypothetical protein NE237_020410 [Protea cynaroides]|uniref:CRAL-TRIO domain-containing protein n=1 Tax=Protea cynaroides TaxID=273540 RepID=A0A9Q0K3E7_9MAGN|nr:hypothetical protein NE237_020410 [Protea cynaroides]
MEAFLTNAEHFSVSEIDKQKAWYLLGVLLSIGCPAPPVELAARCTLFCASLDFVHHLCLIPASPLFLTNDLVVTMSSVALSAFKELVSKAFYDFLPRVMLGVFEPRKTRENIVKIQPVALLTCNLNTEGKREKIVRISSSRLQLRSALCNSEMGSKDATVEAAKFPEDCAEKNEIERSKVGFMRIFVEKEDPSAKDEDDLQIRRFLRARDLDIEKASALFLKYLKWRRSFVPNGSISESEIQNHLAQNKLFMQGSDKKGRPIVVVLSARHFPTKGGVDEFKRYVVYSLDRICARMPQGQEKFVGIADLEGWGYSNSDIRGYLGALSILQDYYPERLGKLLLVHVPYLFMKAWKIVYPFIDKNTREKIIFVENKKLISSLVEEINDSQLPEIYGGKLPLVPIQDS